MNTCKHGENKDTCIVCNEGQYELYIKHLKADLDKLLAVVRAAEGHFEGHRDHGDGTTCAICNAVHSMKERP